MGIDAPAQGEAKTPGRTGERVADLCFLLVPVFYALMYVYQGLLVPYVPGSASLWFGFDRVAYLGKDGLFVLALLLASTTVLGRRRAAVASVVSRAERWLWTPPYRLALAGGAAAVVCFLLRNNFLNPDGRALEWKFARDVPLSGAHVTHDEMWELYLHSRFWWHTNQWFDWSVPFSYQVVSSIAGGAFVILLLWYCRKASPGRALPMFLCVVSGGFMQLFFGDVENYTLTAALLMAYFLAAQLYLEGRAPLVAVATILAVAMTFHLLSAFLLPSLAFMVFLEIRAGRRRSVLTSTLVFVSVLAGTLSFFHLQGLPISHLYWHSHAFGHGGDIASMLAQPSWAYYRRILNLVFLLMPVSLFLLPLVVFGGIGRDRTTVHLALAAVAAVAFMGLWEAKLGVYRDWNLFAAAAIPFSLLAARGLASLEYRPLRWWAAVTGTALGGLHTYAWIVGNHLLFRQR